MADTRHRATPTTVCPAARRRLTAQDLGRREGRFPTLWIFTLTAECPPESLGVKTVLNAEDSRRGMGIPDDQTATAVATTTIVCIECRRPWLMDSERWRLKVTDDPKPETVPYCPDCATREFG